MAYETLYRDFIQACGVGINDLVASSPNSYVSYTKSSGRLSGETISPATLRSEQDVLRISGKLLGKRADKTISNYKSAMRQYVNMVRANGL